MEHTLPHNLPEETIKTPASVPIGTDTAESDSRIEMAMEDGHSEAADVYEPEEAPATVQGAFFKWAAGAAEEINNYESVKLFKKQTSECIAPVQEATLPYWEKTVEYTVPAWETTCEVTSAAVETTKQYTASAYETAAPLAAEAAERTKEATMSAYDTTKAIALPVMEKTKDASMHAAESFGPAFNEASKTANEWCTKAYNTAENTSAQLHAVLSSGTEDDGTWRNITPNIDEDFIHVPSYPDQDSAPTPAVELTAPETEQIEREDVNPITTMETVDDQSTDQEPQSEQDVFL